MDARPAGGLADPSPAWLTIHTSEVSGRSGLDAAMQRWRARWSAPPRLSLRVDDLQGRRLADIADAGPLTTLQLPPGTCVVTATCGAARRGYTLTLVSGRRFELHLQRETAA